MSFLLSNPPPPLAVQAYPAGLPFLPDCPTSVHIPRWPEPKSLALLAVGGGAALEKDLALRIDEARHRQCASSPNLHDTPGS